MKSHITTKVINLFNILGGKTFRKRNKLTELFPCYPLLVWISCKIYLKTFK
jgi:hypothetical protein